MEIPSLNDYSEVSIREFALQYVLQVHTIQQDSVSVQGLIDQAHLVENYLRNGVEIEEDDKDCQKV